MLGLTDGMIDVFDYIASVIMATYKALVMTEEYDVCVDGESFSVIRKGNKYYRKNDLGQSDTHNPIDPEKIQEKVLAKSSIPLTPATGFTGRGDNYSKVSLEWLKWVEEGLGRPLTTALSDSGEFRIAVSETNQIFRVDGYDEQTKTVYEFLGVSIAYLILF